MTRIGDAGKVTTAHVEIDTVACAGRDALVPARARGMRRRAAAGGGAVELRVRRLARRARAGRRAPGAPPLPRRRLAAGRAGRAAAALGEPRGEPWRPGALAPVFASRLSDPAIYIYLNGRLVSFFSLFSIPNPI